MLARLAQDPDVKVTEQLSETPVPKPYFIIELAEHPEMVMEPSLAN